MRKAFARMEKKNQPNKIEKLPGNTEGPTRDKEKVLSVRQAPVGGGSKKGAGNKG